MATEQQRQQAILGALLAALALLLAWQFWPTASPATQAGTTGTAARAAVVAAQSPVAASGDVAAPPHVDLEALGGPRPGPDRPRRNPFRLGAEAPPPGSTPVPVSPPVPAPPVNAGPPLPPPPPPIPLKFIGSLTAATTGRIAVLSDGKFVYYGREGDIIDGRYRVVKIGEESLQIEYFDGRGRQTLRMSGA
jgi:hypothetical protein